MGNLTVSIKRFLGNKNTVTIIGVIIGVLVIYIGYTWRVSQAIEPQKIPYAKVELVGNTQITREQIGTIEVSKKMISQTPGLVTSQAQVIGKYVSYDSKIPVGGLFYSSQLMTEQETPDYVTKDIPKCYTIYSLPVNMHSTYGNAIMPGKYIDLYISATSDDSGKTIVAKLIESIQVKDVRDSQGKSVFSSQSTTNIPAELIFAVRNDMFVLLTRADNIRTNNIKIFPVPRNAEYSSNASQTLVASQEIQEFIESKSDLSYGFTTQIDQSCVNQ